MCKILIFDRWDNNWFYYANMAKLPKDVSNGLPDYFQWSNMCKRYIKCHWLYNHEQCFKSEYFNWELESIDYNELERFCGTYDRRFTYQVEHIPSE